MTMPNIPTVLMEPLMDPTHPDGLETMFDDIEGEDDRLPGRAGVTSGGERDGRPPAQNEMTDPIPGGGPLLEQKSPSRVFKMIERPITRQDRLSRNRDEEGKHWDRVRRGIPFSFLEKSEDQAVWEAKLPPGVMDRPQPIPNKVLELSNKQVSQILVDPPLPNPKPDGGSEKTRGAMDLAGRFLRADGDASGTNDSALWREVLTLNRTRKSAFVYVWVDKTGGGWRPKQIKAHPFATDPKNPLVGPVIDPKTGQPMLDPATGQPVLERTGDPVLRYVAEAQGPDGQTQQVFTKNPSEAAREWLPKHRRRLIHPNQVRTIPQTANAFDADAIVMLMWESLRLAKRRFPQLQDMSKDELADLTQWKPKRWKSIVPHMMRPKGEGLDQDGEVTDDTLVFWYHHFCRISDEYPDGAEVCVSGATMNGSVGYILLRDTLREDVEAEDGTTVPVLMDPPVIQFTALFDVDSGDPFGLAPISLYGGANEIRSHLILSALEDIDIRLHPNIYMPAESGVTRDDMMRRDETPIDVLTKDHMPTFEERPAMPTYLPTMVTNIETDMKSEANLNETAEGLDSAYAASGKAKQIAIGQARVQLAQEWQGFVNGVLQYWTCKLQLGQARLTVPQLVRIGGENSAFKSRYFVGGDMLGVTAVALLPGSLTMMSTTEKSAYLAQAQNQQWIDKDEAGEMFRSSMSDDLGMPPNPHEEHIDRAIADWIEGPPKDWEKDYQAYQAYGAAQKQYEAKLQQAAQALTQQQKMPPQQAQATAAQQLGAAPTAPKTPYTPFEARPNDEEPVVARIYYAKLSKLMSTTEYKEQPLEWRSCVDSKYIQEAFAAGIQTVRQQQQAQQQQHEKAQQDEIQKLTVKQSAKNAPPSYEQFLATIQSDVMADVEKALSKAASGQVVGEDKPEMPAPVTPPEGPDPTHPLDLAHETMENARDRQHELAMATRKHMQTIQAGRDRALTTPVRQPAGVP